MGHGKPGQHLPGPHRHQFYQRYQRRHLPGALLAAPHFSTAHYASLNFWINGGPGGGQSLTVHGVVNGNGVGNYSIGPLTANTWQQFTIPLSSLGIANQANVPASRFKAAAAPSPFTMWTTFSSSPHPPPR